MVEAAGRSPAPPGWLGRLRRRGPRDWGVAVTGVLALLTAAYAVGFVLGWGGPDLRAKVTYALYLPLTSGPMLLAWRVARRGSLPPATRRAWRRLGVGLAGWFLANVGWLWFEAIRGVDTPVVVDAVYLTAAGVMLVGLLALPGRRRTREERLRLAMDVGVVVAAAFVAMWYLVLGPATTIEESDLVSVVVAVAYPVADLVLVFGIVTALLRGTPASSSGSLRLLLLGIGAYVVADVVDGYMSLHGGEVVGLGWTHLLWLGGLLLFAVAADSQWAQAVDDAAEEPARRRTFSVLPYVAVAGGYGLLLIVARGLALYPLGGMLVGSVVMIALVVTRQLSVLRENARLTERYHELATTDALTGLANRRHLLEVGERLFKIAARADRPMAAVMIDVDHFKPINDVYGHGAGDAVLREVAERCQGELRDSDLLGRYGGDELVALLPETGAEGAVGVADRIRDAVTGQPVHQGGGVLVLTLSLGVADSEGCRDLDGLLHHADMALYEAKRRGRDQAAVWSASGQGARTRG
jgi:diguanylate cyclase (GGDEF)-like protein